MHCLINHDSKPEILLCSKSACYTLWIPSSWSGSSKRKCRDERIQRGASATGDDVTLSHEILVSKTPMGEQQQLS